jgi:hypothetical protein
MLPTKRSQAMEQQPLTRLILLALVLAANATRNDSNSYRSANSLSTIVVRTRNLATLGILLIALSAASCVDGLADVLSWGQSNYYDTGVSPSVAVTGSWAIEVQGQDIPNRLMTYHLGSISGGALTWGPQQPIPGNGLQPGGGGKHGFDGRGGP